MTCTACETARLRTSGLYLKGCNGCTARSIARSQAAFNALDSRGTGETEPLIETIERLLPAMGLKAARRAVWDWWKSDHPETK